jgi:SAM-dependent methyltransferase
MAATMKDEIRAFILERWFRPGLVGLLTNPFYAARKELFKNVESLSHLIQGRVLDVGCGSKPYRQLFQCSEYVGLEIDTAANRLTKRADYFYDGLIFPFEDAQFDTIIASQVLEHVFNPTVFLGELNRVLRPEGGVMLTVPFAWDEHEQPFDYARYTSFGLKHLLEQNGFDLIVARKSVSDIRVVFQLLNCYLHKQFAGRNVYFKVIAWSLLTAPFNVLGEILFRVLPANKDLYLDNVVFARKVREIDREKSV